MSSAREVLGTLAVCAVLLAAVVAGAGALARWKCLSEWEASGIPVRWAYGSGCQLQRADGTWAPARVLRELRK